MTIDFVCPFKTTAFLQVDALYSTNRLWKSNVLDGVDQRCICFLPKSDDSFVLSEDFGSTRTVYGYTRNCVVEETICIYIPLPKTPLEDLKDMFESLAEEFDCEIVVSDKQIYNNTNNNASESDFSVFYIHAIGLKSNVKVLEPQFHSFLQLHTASQTAKPLFVDTLDVSSISLLPMCLGIDGYNAHHIKHDYKTTLMAPSLITCSRNNHLQLIFSGPIHGLVLHSKSCMEKYIKKIQGSLYYRRFTGVSPGKLAFIKRFCEREVTHLMSKFQTCIKITNDNTIEFQTLSPQLLDIVCKVFTTKILQTIAELQIITKEPQWDAILAIQNNMLQESEGFVLMHSPERPNHVILVGRHTLDQETSITIPKSWSKFVNNPNLSITQLKLIFEIHPDFEDFISGKKNGKFTRIIEKSDCLLELSLVDEDENMFLTMISETLEGFWKSFINFVGELPAEESFFIPEVYHRPVIGAGGSLIQTTMRKHNVFIQFSNSFLLPQNEFSFIRYDNVIIRCPSKNKASILLAKEELTALAQGYGNHQNRTLIKFPPGQYRYLLAHNTQIIANIEKACNVYILFPEVEQPHEYNLEIRGNNDNSLKAANDIIKSAFGIQTDFLLDNAIADEAEFINAIVVPFAESMEIEVSCNGKTVSFTYTKSNNFLEAAKDLLKQFLEKLNIRLVGERQIDQFITQPPVEGMVRERKKLQQVYEPYTRQKNAVNLQSNGPYYIRGYGY